MRSPLLAFLVISAAVSGAAIVACGGNSPEPTTPSTTADGGGAAEPSSSGGATASAAADAGGGAATTGDPTKPTAAGEPDFDALPKDKKVDIMMAKVVPNVGKLFKEHNGKKWAKFTCGTCHGPAKEKSKEDPHKVLPKLTFSNGGYAKLEKSKADMMKFMNEKVLPAMAEAVGEKASSDPKDPKSKGFNCGGCHTVD